MNADIFALLIKVSTILGAAACAAFVMRRSSAARRHFVWSAAMSSVVVLMVLQLFVPPIVVSVAQNSALAAIAYPSSKSFPPSEFAQLISPPSHVSDVAVSDAFETSQTVSQTTPHRATQPGELPSSASVSPTSRPTPRPVANRLSPAPQSLGATSDERTRSNVASLPSILDDKHPADQEKQTKSVGHAVFASTLLFTREQLRTFLLSAWAFGSLLLLLRIALAHWQLRRIVHSSHVIRDSVMEAELEQLEMRLGLNKAVRLLVHAGVNTPCTAGWRTPIILLPASFREWSNTRRRAVFTHELAHVARGDSVAQFMASVACALFWFHPAFWLVARLLRAEGERAADDCVIASGMRPVEYADHLLAIANGSSTLVRVPTVALGMARSSQLELRMRAMLNTKQSRTVFTHGAQRILGSAALLAVIPFAALQARVQQQPPVPPRVVQPAPQPPRVPPTVVQPPSVKPPTAPHAQVAVPPMVVPERAPSTVAPPTGVNVPGALRSRGVRAPGQSPPVVLPPSGVRQPPIPPPSVIAPPLTSRGTVTPPLPSQRVVSPPLPARDIPSPSIQAPPTSGPPIVVPPITRIPTPAVRRDTMYEFTIDAKAGDSLIVNIPAGGNVTVHGWDSNTAKLKASIGGKYWRETRVFFRARKNGISLFAAPEIDGVKFAEMTRGDDYYNIVLRSPGQPGQPRGYVPTTVDNEFEIWVPRKTHVKFTSPIGALTLRDIDGDVDGVTKLGSLDIANASGKASLVTENGDIRVASSALTGSVHTNCGAVSVSNAGQKLAATTTFDPTPFSKPGAQDKLIIIDGIVSSEYCRLKPRVIGLQRVDESIPYGPIALDSAPNGGNLLTRSGDITLGTSGGALIASTSNANIDIRRMGGDITAMNRNGNVDIRVVNTDGTVHNAWIRASSGTVTLELPDSIDADVDIEVSYTEEFLQKFKRAARIRDDRRLPQTETVAWNRINDEPLRKFVRTRGTLGKGTGRIYIRVTDGDVVLKGARA